MKAIVFAVAMTAIALVSAAPAPASNSPFVATELEKCLAAENCETYETPQGTMMRFKAGMEPGSADYRARFGNSTAEATHDLQRRDGGVHTYVNFGKESINYGTTNPSDALHHCLYDNCHESYCDTTVQCTMPTQDIYHHGRDSWPRDRNILIKADGHFDGWTQRNWFVDAVVIAASKGQKWEEKEWCQVFKEGSTCGSQWQGTQSNFITVGRWVNGNMQGYISAWIEMDDKNSGWCKIIANINALVAGPIKASVANFWGEVDAHCDAIEGQ